MSRFLYCWSIIWFLSRNRFAHLSHHYIVLFQLGMLSFAVAPYLTPPSKCCLICTFIVYVLSNTYHVSITRRQFGISLNQCVCEFEQGNVNYIYIRTERQCGPTLMKSAVDASPLQLRIRESMWLPHTCATVSSVPVLPSGLTVLRKVQFLNAEEEQSGQHLGATAKDGRVVEAMQWSTFQLAQRNGS